MLFMVRFIDKTDARDVRDRYLKDHIAWLDQNKAKVLIGGSLRIELGDHPVGGLWIVDASDRLEIEAIVQSDPFWAKGLRQSVEILHWSKAFPGRDVSI